MRSCGFLWAVSIPLCFKHHTGHTSCAGLRAKERPCAHAPLALLRLPSDKPSFDTCPLGLPHPEAKQQKVKPGPFRVPSAVGQLRERGSAGKPEPGQQEVKKEKAAPASGAGFPARTQALCLHNANTWARSCLGWSCGDATCFEWRCALVTVNDGARLLCAS